MGSTPSRASRPADDVASTGVAALDDVLGGLFWGDKVFLEVAEPPASTPFYRAVANVAGQYDKRLYV